MAWHSTAWHSTAVFGGVWSWRRNPEGCSRRRRDSGFANQLCNPLPSSPLGCTGATLGHTMRAGLVAALVPGHLFAYAGPGWAAGPGRAEPGRARHRRSALAVTQGTRRKAPGRCGKPGLPGCPPGRGDNSNPGNNVPDLGICKTFGGDLHQTRGWQSPALPCASVYPCTHHRCTTRARQHQRLRARQCK